MMLKRQRGFTLIEVMITVAIVAILAAIAFPSYQDSMRKSRRADSKNALTQAVANMERFYAQNNGYCIAASCATMTTCNSTPVICPGACSAGVCTSTERNYTIAFGAAPTLTTFTIEATPVTGGPQVVDGKMNINQTNLKFHDMNNNGAYSTTTENYWK